MKKIFLLIIGFNLAAFGVTSIASDTSKTRFVEKGDTVIDNATKLQWQNTKLEDKEWDEAIEYCENLELEGYNDWRLPNINELKSIRNFSRTLPALYEVFNSEKIHESRDISGTWSSTTTTKISKRLITPAPLRAFVVEFNYGNLFLRSKNKKSYVRCVRGGA